jgi:hypothetical protein
MQITKEMMEIGIAFITGVLGPVLILFVKSYLEKNNKKVDLLTEAVEHSDVVNSMLDGILADKSVDRAWILQFHNGGHYYPTGKSIQKFSMFFEVVRHAKDSVRLQYQNIPVNLFSKSLSQIVKTGEVIIPDYRDEETATYGLKYIAEENGTRSSYLFAIKNPEGRIIGVLGIEYTGRKKELEHATIQELKFSAATLGGVLMNHLKK